MNLTVVTHTNIKWKRDLTKVMASVKDALPEKCRHEIIETTDEFTQFNYVRYSAMNIDDVVVFVDDDDYISNDSLYHVLDALRNTDVGIAYTREVIVVNDKLTPSAVSTDYRAISNNPNSIHHMTAFNTKYVTGRSLDISMKYGPGSAEWSMKADAAGNGGAIHIPIDGYYWVQHRNQVHHDTAKTATIRNNLKLMGSELLTWNKQTNPIIPTWKLTY